MSVAADLYLSAQCDAGDHHLCRPDLWRCDRCCHDDEASASAMPASAACSLPASTEPQPHQTVGAGFGAAGSSSGDAWEAPPSVAGCAGDEADPSVGLTAAPHFASTRGPTFP